jgi:hypothetical protein
MNLKLKKSAVAIAVLVIVAIPITANATAIAWLVPTQISNMALWAKDKADKLYRLAKEQAEKMASLAKLEASTLTSQDTAAQQVTSTTEKETAALKELTQSELNYAANAHTSRGSANAEEKFSSPVELQNMCDVATTTEKIAAAKTRASIAGKALGSTLVRRDLAIPRQNLLPTIAAQTHNTSYCSQEDKKAGRCDPVAPLLLQNADVQAGTLMLPNNGTTYTKAESEAAQDFIKMVTNPDRSVDLAPGLEKAPQGAAYLVTFRAATAQMSVAYNSMSQLWANRVADDSVSEAIDSTGDLELSVLGVMKKFAYDRFVDQRWKENLAGMDVNGTLREIAITMAGKNFTTLQAFQQRQRMEALVATKLSIDAEESNEARLIQLRQSLHNSR